MTETGNKLIQKGEKTRSGILAASVDIASAEGLDGLTIGRLARDLGMSKSGLFAHFGSKTDLQIATVEEARDVFEREIIDPCEEEGLTMLLALLENWVSYVERSVFRGGCFFFAASAEFDDRPGKVRDLVAKLTMEWVEILRDQIEKAVAKGELKSVVDPDLLVFQVHGSVQEANWFYRLHEDETAFEKARKSILQSIESRVTPKGAQIIFNEEE